MSQQGVCLSPSPPPPPQKKKKKKKFFFQDYDFLEPQGLLSCFPKSATWRVGLLEVIEVKGHQVHLLP